MQVQTHPLEPFFLNAIRSSYEGRLGLGPDISSYVSRMLCDFSEEDNLYRLHDAKGQPIQKLRRHGARLRSNQWHGTLLHR